MAIHNRRALHQPFYPLVDSPPTPPSPFFPLYPSPPPPKPSLPSIPTNPSSPLISHRHSRHNLLPLVAVPAAALAVLLLALVAALLRRRSSAAAQSRRLFPPDDDGSKLPAAAPNSASEFLYLGTLISSRSGDPSVPAARSPYLKLGSPELRPLPPLSRHADNGGCSSEEDSYYSPSGGSPADKRGNVGSASRSPKVFPITVSGKCESTFSTVSSPSYPSSPSSPLISSSPIEFRPSPKRETSSPQLEKESNVKSKSSGLNGIGDFARNPFVMGPPPSRAPPTPPPPPPPLLETRVSKLPIGQPPVLLPPKPIGAKINAAAIFPADATDNWDGSQKSEGNKRRLKLKPLHWDKVRAKSDQAMVWDLLRSSSFKIDEEMIEALFVCETTNPAMVQQVGFSSNQENGVLDPKKSQNFAIILRALSVTKEEVCEGLLEGNTERLGNELLETLLKMAPSKEEEFRLKEYKDDGPFKLGPAEKFLKAVLDVPFAFKRLDAMLYITDFESEINYLRQSFQTLEAACAELRSSRLFFKLLEAVLKTGNRMNVGTNHGDAQAFKLDTLLKLADVKGTDGKTTLLHFVVQEIIKAEGARFSASESDASTSQDDLECTRIGLRVLSGLGGELCNVRKAASTDPDVLSDYVTKLSGGIGKISEVLGLNQELNSDRNQRFHDSMNGFLKRANNEIVELQVQQRSVMSLVKDITVYFHGDSAKEEAHPIRIFLVVRDFLAILDQVCKEVGRINERNICSMNRISVVVNPAVFPKISTSKLGSSDDESSSSLSF